MEYLSIKSISAKYEISERTAYLKLKANPKIRRKKQGKTKLIHVADFAAVCSWEFHLLQSIAVKNPKIQEESDFQKLQTTVADLQSSLAVVKEQKDNLQKFNSNLQELANDRALALTEMKAEKNQRLDKFENLQTSHNQFMQDYFRKYYILFGVSILLALLLFFQNLPTLVQFFG